MMQGSSKAWRTSTRVYQADSFEMEIPARKCPRRVTRRLYLADNFTRQPGIALRESRSLLSHRVDFVCPDFDLPPDERIYSRYSHRLCTPLTVNRFIFFFFFARHTFLWTVRIQMYFVDSDIQYRRFFTKQST